MELNVVFATVESNKWCLTPFICVGALGKLVNGPVPPSVPRMGMGRHIETKAEIAKASAKPPPAPQGSRPSPPKPEITPPPVPTNP